MSQALAAQPETAKVPFAEDLQRNKGALASVLPPHINADKFIRTVMTAVTQTPDLLQVDRRTLFNACVKCATDGLIPDGREAALVVFNVKDKNGGGWVKSAQYMPMVRGLIKLARQSGEISTLSAHIVREGDEFEYVLGDDERLIHKPNLDGTGAAKLVYATVTFKDGTKQREVMTMAEVNKARAVSRSKDSGPWASWFDEMARKTVIRRLLKYVTLSPDLARAVDRDDDDEFEGMKRAALAAVPKDTHAEALAALAAPAADEATDPPAPAEEEISQEPPPFDWQGYAASVKADFEKHKTRAALQADYDEVRERLTNEDAPEEILGEITQAFLEAQRSKSR